MYKNKYLKYKLKYKKISLIGGGLVPFKINEYNDYFDKHDINLAECVKELVESSYSIYQFLLEQNKPITLICGGQSPSYYCLSMMNLSIYNSDKVNIIIMPHSKGGTKSIDQFKEDLLYCERLKEKNIKLRDNVYILDGVHTGTGILALKSSLKYCFKGINIKTIAINKLPSVAQIEVDHHYILPCEPLFSDLFPRLVVSYRPEHFGDSSKFITEFIGLNDNPIAAMIIRISKLYKNDQFKIEDDEWYKLNDNGIYNDQKWYCLDDLINSQKTQTYYPIIIDSVVGKLAICPICNMRSIIEMSENNHFFDCPNYHKTAILNFEVE